MVPHAREIFEKFQAMGLGDSSLKFEVTSKEGHWHLTWRNHLPSPCPWLFH